VFRKPIVKDDAYSSHRAEKAFDVIIGAHDVWVDLHKRSKVPMFYSGNPDAKEGYIADGITLAIGVVFGAIHCIAWSFDFPSHTELLLWRLSSVAITTVPALLLVIVIVGILKNEWGWVARPHIALLIFLMPLAGLLYVASRLTTLVLAFMNLSSLPPGAFQAVHWTTLIPHL
jgi:hypothetical protein